MRNAAARLRRPATTKSNATPDTTETPKPPRRPRRPRAPRQPGAATTSGTARPGWFARWFGLPPRRSAEPRRRPAASGTKYQRFTPETHPGLGQEACDILNTPVGESDPEVLRMLFAGLARHIADTMPPGSGMADPQAVFAVLWGRMSAVLGPADAPAEQPKEAPADQPEAAPAIPAAVEPQTEAPDAAADAPWMPSDERSEAARPDAQTSTAIVLPTAPHATLQPTAKPEFHRGRPLPFGRRRLVRYRHETRARSVRTRQRSLPPPPRLYYACAGPP